MSNVVYGLPLAPVMEFAPLGCQVPDRCDEAHRAGNVLVDNRVVVEVHGDWPIVLPGDVVIGGVLPPLVEGAVVISSVEPVVQPQTCVLYTSDAADE